MSTPSSHDNFEAWLEAFKSGHPFNPTETHNFTYDDMFAAWVGGAIFAANKLFNPSVPAVPPLPDIFRDTNEPGSD